MTAFIRPYQPSDSAAMIHVFRTTAHQELRDAGDPALHYASYNWARPYLSLVPEHCLVLDDGQGTPVGYLLGAPDTRRYEAMFRERYLPALTAQGMAEPPETDGDDMATSMQRFTWHPESMLVDKFPNLLQEYPAHLHVDILPEYQGRGHGRALMERIVERFRGLGVAGIHLGKVGNNFGAGEFYVKLGFERFPEVMDGGRSGEMGRTGDGGVYMVRKL